MDKFLIVLIDGKVSVSYCEDGEIVVLKNEGEEEWEFDENEFWEWFKEKIDYSNEELSFVVVSDRDFKIDKSIKLNKINAFEKDELCKEKIKSINLKYPLATFPSINFHNSKNLIKKPEKIKNITKKTIADVFLRITKEYENEKK